MGAPARRKAEDRSEAPEPATPLPSNRAPECSGACGDSNDAGTLGRTVKPTDPSAYHRDSRPHEDGARLS
jgi:hypothetical protein